MIKSRDHVGHQGLDDDEVTRHIGEKQLHEREGWTHLIDTPKHLIAMAASKNTAARGKVSSATVKNDARRCGALTAQSESRYSPNAATPPEKRHVIMPGMTPVVAMA